MSKIFTIFFLGISILSKSQVNDRLDGKWLVNLSLPDIGTVTTILEFESESSTYKAYSRKDADKLLLGKVKAPLIRGISNFKNGSLIRVEKGEYIEIGDTIKLTGVLVSSMGNYNFIGNITKDSIAIALSKKNLLTIGKIIGTKKNFKTPLEDYSKLFLNAMEISKDKIYKKSLINENKWKTFVNNMKEILPEIKDDLEMVSAFYYFSQKLKMSHFALLKSIEKFEEKSSPKKYASLLEKSASTAYLKIISFNGTAQEIDSIFKIITQKNYENLIVDLRDNQGGTIESGMAFANNVFLKPINGGVFLTQKWFNNNSTLPSLAEYNQFESFSQSNYDLIIKGIHDKNGLFLKVLPNINSFKGNLYILINKNTASTCEPLVYELKQQNRAVVVGEKTAGAMLNGEKFELFNNFFLYLPTADYYASDGFRIEQNGILPNIKTKSDDALDKVILELIKK